MWPHQKDKDTIIKIKAIRLVHYIKGGETMQSIVNKSQMGILRNPTGVNIIKRIEIRNVIDNCGRAKY